MNTPVIVGLAMLKARWEVQQKDYLDNFVPLAAECIRLSESEVVSLQELQDGLQERFDLRIPQKTVGTLLRRLADHSYVVAQNRAYYRNPDALLSLDFSKTQKEFLKSYEHIIEVLCKFASEKHKTEWTEQNTENALLGYLNTFQFRSSPTGFGLEGIAASNNSNKGSKSENYIVGDFVNTLTAEQSANLDFFDTISKGHMLSQAIFLYEIGEEQRRFRGTDVYIDSPLLIFVLGYAGKPRQAPVMEMFELARSAGANLCCFRHSYEEMRGILHSCADRIGKRQINSIYNPSVEYFLEIGKSETDILLILEQLEADLCSLGISIIEKPSHATHRHGIDEKGFEVLLNEAVNYSNRRALERDIDSVAAIYRLRQALSFTHIEECKAVFITANSALARSARHFFAEDFGNNSVPLCYTDYLFTTLLWLKRPNHAPDLPKKRLIAACYAATQPDEVLWNQYLHEISKLEMNKRISSQQYYLLRHSIHAKSELMRITKGEQDVFSEGTIPEIYKCIEEQIRADDKAELASEKSRSAQLEQEVAAMHEREQQKETEEQQEQQRKWYKAKLRAQTYSKWIGRIIVLLSTIAIGVILHQTSSLGTDIDSLSWNLTKWILIILQWIVIISGAVNLVIGFTFIPYIKKLEDIIEDKILNILVID